MNLIEKTRAVHHSMLEAYFSTRDLDAVIGRFDPEIMWFGTGKNDTARNYDSAVSMLRRGAGGLRRALSNCAFRL